MLQIQNQMLSITNGVTSATTSGFYSRKFNDKGFFYS